MSRTAARSIFGVHSFTPYSRSTGMFYGMSNILESGSLSLSGELIDLFAGSNKYQWASEQGKISAEMSLKFGEMPDFFFELFLGKAPTATTSETSGNVTTAVNKYGTSMISAVGLASVTVLAGSKANLKFGRYVIKAISGTTVKLYCSSDVDLNRGTDVAIDDDSNSVTSAALTIVAATATDITSLGLTLTGGAGVIGMTVGDTATFDVRPVNSRASVAVIGASADVRPEFGAVLMAQKRGADELFEVNAYRCIADGMPIGFETFAWAKPEVKAKLLYDSTKDGVFEMRAVVI
jgi:hypothetical protein